MIMEFTTEDLQQIEDAAKRFIDTEVAPHLNDWEEAGEFPRALYGRAAELGWLGLGYPEELGGTPAPWSVRLAAKLLGRYEERGKLEPPEDKCVGSSVVVLPFLAFS